MIGKARKDWYDTCSTDSLLAGEGHSETCRFEGLGQCLIRPNRNAPPGPRQMEFNWFSIDRSVDGSEPFEMDVLRQPTQLVRCHAACRDERLWPAHI